MDKAIISKWNQAEALNFLNGHQDEIDPLLTQNSKGFNWTFEEIIEEVKKGAVLWVLGIDSLQSILLFRMLNDVADILLLATAPPYQRKGGMRALLQELQNHPEVREIWLEVHELNHPARALYQNMGFYIVGQRVSYYQDGGHAVLMSFNGVEKA